MKAWRPWASLGLSLSSLVALATTAAPWHLPAAVLGCCAVSWLTPSVGRSVGSWRRWLPVTAVLVVLGAALGRADHDWMGLPVSLAGAVAGSTMVARAIVLVLVGACVAGVVPIRKSIERVRHPGFRRLVEVVVLAANFVPVLLRVLADAHETLEERRPGWRRWPQRAGLLAVHAVVRAATLAEDVAFETMLHGANCRPERVDQSDREMHAPCSRHETQEAIR